MQREREMGRETRIGIATWGRGAVRLAICWRGRVRVRLRLLLLLLVLLVLRLGLPL